MKHLLLPLALCSLSLVFTSCANRDRPEPPPLGRYRYDPPGGNLPIYYGPSAYPGAADRGLDYPAYRTPAKTRENPSLSNTKRSANFPGGPQDWYKMGAALGNRDRAWQWSPEYKRHREAYDARTEADFALGYNDGYSARNHKG